MSSPTSPEVETSEEVAALIATLHETGRRLEELTAGEVDAVTDRNGQTFLLRSAQERLRWSEAAKQAAVLNALPAHIAMLDVRGVIVSVNDRWRHFGDSHMCQSPDNGVGTNYLELCDRARGNGSASAHQAAQGIRSVLNGESPDFSIEYPCHSPNERRWFMLTVTPLNDSEVHGVVVMHMDVSARVRVTEALDAQHIELHALFNMIPSMVWVKDTSNNIVHVNQHAADAAGTTIAALEGRSLSDIYSRDAASYFADDQEVLRSGHPSLGIIETVMGADGTDVWVQTDKVPLIASDGSVVGIMVVATDVTNIKRAESDLRESERRFSDMLDHVQLASMMLDCEGRVTYCNDYLLQLSGWSRDEMTGKDWFECFVPADVSNMRTTLASLRANLTKPRHVESDLLTRTGERRLIRWNNSVLRSGSGEVIGTSSIGEDITERNAAEAVLAQRATELERFHRLSVGRELQMIELKKQINEMQRQSGEEPAYNLAFLDSETLHPDAGNEPVP